MRAPERTQSAKTWDYVYLDDGELDTVTNPDGDVTDHQYLSDGRLKKIVLDSTATREFFYQDTNDSHAYVSDENTHLRKTLDKTNGGTAICSFAYELDAAGIRRSITDKDGKYRVFTYDPKYQLKSEMLWSAKVPGTRSDALLWTYDGNGNRLTQHDDGVLTGYVYGSNNEMTDAGSDAFTFDNFGNTASIVGVETYSYDFESHMTQREASGGSTDTHEYDGDGRRMRSKLDDAADWTHFIHDELTENLICEYTLISGTFTIKALNTYGLGLISSNRQGTIRYFHFDGLGTTHHLTDSSQSVTDSYTYDAFGVPTSATGSSTNPYRYVGQWGYYDDGAMGSTSEMLLLGVRYYWPKYGRFLAWDAVPSKNLYRYCKNAVTYLVDPDGRLPIVLIALAVAAIAAAGCGSEELGIKAAEEATYIRTPCTNSPDCAKLCDLIRLDNSSVNFRTTCWGCCSEIFLYTADQRKKCMLDCIKEPREAPACICPYELVDRVYSDGGPYYA
jgi:RHS repeat-associated protein